MRWDALFADLEAQLAAAERADLDVEIGERARVEAANIELADRLRGSLGPGSASIWGPGGSMRAS